MTSWRVVLVAASACGFRHGAAGSGSIDASDSPAAGSDARADAPLDAGCSTKSWFADFSSDPTTLDGNGDGIFDFAMRDGAALGGTLSMGEWTEPGTSPRALDSQPKQDFVTRTRVHVRMRGLVVPSSGHGAVFWINVGYDGTSFSPLFVDATLDNNGTQTATLYGKLDNATEVVLASTTGLDTSMHDYYLDIMPLARSTTFTVDSLPLGTKTFQALPVAGNDDRWATVTAWNGADSQFDSLRVDVDCP